MNIDRTPWIPTANTVICIDHFVGNKPIRRPNSPDYIPTIFPTAYKNQKVNSNQQDSRYQHFCSHEAVPRSTVTSVKCNEDTNQSQSNDIVNHVGVQVLLDVSDVFAKGTTQYWPSQCLMPKTHYICIRNTEDTLQIVI